MNETKERDSIEEQPTIVSTVVEVKNGGFSWDDGVTWLGVPEGADPKPGDQVEIWGEFGRPVRGVAFNAVVAFYRTEEEQAAKDKEWVENQNREKREKFEAEKEDYYTRVDALPQPFRARFVRFRTGNPDFDVEYGNYELMVCEQAVLLASKFDTPEQIKAWSKLGFDKQIEQFPEMDRGHSGNSHGCMTNLAYWFKKEPSLVKKMHGALVGLVGCEAYGCTHPKQEQS